MKINIWIRPGEGNVITLRTDLKYEDRDTPVIQRYGRKLIDAIECGAKIEKGSSRSDK